MFVLLLICHPHPLRFFILLKVNCSPELIHERGMVWGVCDREREREKREKVFDATWMKQDPFTSPEPQHGSWRRRRRTYSITSLQSSVYAPLLLPFDSGFKRKLQPKARQFFSISFSLALFFLGWALLLVGCLGTPSYTQFISSLSPAKGFPINSIG